MVLDQLVKCFHCKKFLTRDAFHKGENKCKACACDISKKWREMNRDRYLEKLREWRARPKKPFYRRNSRLKYLYGVTEEQCAEVHEKQGGKCAICLQVFDGMPCIDHCHTTGKFRGLLCDLCNRGIGYFKDNPETIEAAVAYLRKQDA